MSIIDKLIEIGIEFKEESYSENMNDLEMILSMKEEEEIEIK